MSGIRLHASLTALDSASAGWMGGFRVRVRSEQRASMARVLHFPRWYNLFFRVNHGIPTLGRGVGFDGWAVERGGRHKHTKGKSHLLSVRDCRYQRMFRQSTNAIICDCWFAGEGNVYCKWSRMSVFTEDARCWWKWKVNVILTSFLMSFWYLVISYF